MAKYWKGACAICNEYRTLEDGVCDDCAPPQPGTDPSKLHHKHGPGTSTEAAHLVDTKTWERRVFLAVRSFGTAGCTQEDVIEKVRADWGADTPYSTITARFKALKDRGAIIYTGERRKHKKGSSSEVRYAKGFEPQQPKQGSLL